MITCEFDGFFLVNAYAPNSKGDLSRLPYRYDSWDPDLKDYLIDLRREKPVVLCGDLNVAHREIDLANPKTNRKNAGFTDEEREGLSNLLAEGFLDSFRHLYPDEEGAYSWWSYRAGARSRNAGWRIDYFIVSDDLATSVRDACILPEWEGVRPLPGRAFSDLGLTDRSRDFGRGAKGEVFQAGIGACSQGVGGVRTRTPWSVP